MHIHGNIGNLQTGNYNSLASQEAAAAAQRAAEVRKRLLRNAQTIGGDTNPEETLMIGQWLDSKTGSRDSQVLGADEWYAAPEGRDSDLG